MPASAGSALSLMTTTKEMDELQLPPAFLQLSEDAMRQLKTDFIDKFYASCLEFQPPTTSRSAKDSEALLDRFIECTLEPKKASKFVENGACSNDKLEGTYLLEIWAADETNRRELELIFALDFLPDAIMGRSWSYRPMKKRANADTALSWGSFAFSCISELCRRMGRRKWYSYYIPGNSKTDWKKHYIRYGVEIWSGPRTWTFVEKPPDIATFYNESDQDSPPLEQASREISCFQCKERIWAKVFAPFSVGGRVLIDLYDGRNMLRVGNTIMEPQKCPNKCPMAHMRDAGPYYASSSRREIPRTEETGLKAIRRWCSENGVTVSVVLTPVSAFDTIEQSHLELYLLYKWWEETGKPKCSFSAINKSAI